MYVLEFRTANRACAPWADGYDALAYSAPSRNGAGRLRKMEKRAADAVRSKIRIMI